MDIEKTFVKKEYYYTNKTLIKSIQDYLFIVEALRQECNSADLWYRGVSDSKLDLVPSIYRENLKEYDSDKEKYMFYEFKRTAYPYLKEKNNTKWELYQLMQHYGTPTRLLDWTESSLIALLFALFELKICKIPCVWILDPHSLNSFHSGKNELYSFDSDEPEDVAIKEKYLTFDSKTPDYPAAFQPSLIDKRIVSQKSCFTIHGNKKNGFKDLSEINDKFKLTQLRFSPNRLEHIQYELMTTGITYSTIFNDLEGLSKDLKYKYNMTR